MFRMPKVFGLAASSFLAALLAGCNGGDGDSKPKPGDSTPPEDTFVPATDADGDGQAADDGDCDDNDSSRYTGRTEECNGIDDNCNGLTDEGFADSDGDGTLDCEGDVEDCDGVDNDGDGQVDEGFADSNGDGVADCVSSEECNGVDDDADGEVDEGYDADGDGYTQCGSATEAADCDDTNAAVNPGASENTTDGLDNDCDGIVDGGWVSGALSITELMNNPQTVGDPYGEWIELHNDSSSTLTLNGLRFSDSSGEWFQIPASPAYTLPPGGFFLLANNGDSTQNGGITPDYVYSGMTLSNESDDLSIWAGDVLVDAISWDDGATMPDPAGASMAVDPGYYGATLNDNAVYWCATIDRWSGTTTGDMGSPGADNLLCSTFDHDGDGYSRDAGDCDDEDATIYPGAPEIDPAIDNDCDGVAEWGPVGYAGATSTGYTCDWIQLSSAGSYDPTGEALTYSWELTSAPASSALTTADIEDPTDANPRFNPDVDGTYTFTLTVTDPGGASSSPVSVSVTTTARPSNTAPVADGGADQTTSGSADCTPISYGVSYDCDDCASTTFTLYATGSSDADDDVLDYTWAITSGSSYGTLDATTGEQVTVTFSGATPTYGSANRTTVTVELTATDCMGASDTDTIDLHYDCTGY